MGIQILIFQNDVNPLSILKVLHELVEVVSIAALTLLNKTFPRNQQRPGESTPPTLLNLSLLYFLLKITIESHG